MERGIQQPTLTTLINLAAALGIKPEMLVTFAVARLRREATHDRAGKSAERGDLKMSQ
jgi:hypothetical protein